MTSAKDITDPAALGGKMNTQLVERLRRKACDRRTPILYAGLFTEVHDEITRLTEENAALAATVERQNEWLVELQTSAFKWMEAHDKLKAGKPYDFPKPADVPEAIAKAEALAATVETMREQILSARSIQREDGKNYWLVPDALMLEMKSALRESGV